jgi:serine protease AprX
MGAAPEISLSVAIALGPSGKSGQEDMVSQAIRWCRISQDADIISLSLGANPGRGMDDESETTLAVQEALDNGIFVVAAAGNTGLNEDIMDVSIPANIEGVISVAASDKNGNIWKNSATGSSSDPYTGEERLFPNQKPEISAPGVRLYSTYSTESDSSLYAYSSGTSDSTVLVTGALALILEKYYEDIAGDDGKIDYSEISRVKRALANSAISDDQDSPHHFRKGYGKLNAISWAEEIIIEFSIQ